MSKIVFKFLWSQKSLGVCLDQRINEKLFIPLTKYFFWPQRDSWEDIKEYMQANPWIDYNESVFLLNELTEIVDFWEKNKNLDIKNLQSVRLQFPNFSFVGYN